MVQINEQEVSNEQLARAIDSDWINNLRLQDMIDAERYYEVENSHIQTKRRTYTNGKGEQIENKSVSNEQLPNAFYRKAVKQKVDYAFGKPPVISVEPINPDTNNEEEEKLYQKAWEDLFDAQTRKTIKTLAHYAINCGIGYVYIYMDDKGFYLVNTPSVTMRPLWIDKGHTELTALLRVFRDKVLQNGVFVDVGKAELWTPQDVSYFDNNNGLRLLSTESHMKGGKENNWGKIPFLWLKGTEDEKPLLKTVKKYIDAYDELNSQSVDILKDDLDAAVIFKNYTSETGKLIDAYKTLKETKVGAVDSDGGVELLKNNPDISAIQTKLEHLKKDINEFSSTVDIQDIQFGNNPSGVAIKAAFQDTDTYINDIEMEFELFIENLKYFYDLYLDWTGKVSKEISSKYKVMASLDRDMMINESEIISDLVKMNGMVSQETLDDNNPYVESHAVEQARRDAETEKQANSDNPFNFPEPEPVEEKITETTEVKNE